MTKEDAYKTLGIAEGADLDAIKKAYRKACLKFHPDKYINKPLEEKQTAHDQFLKIQTAFGVIERSLSASQSNSARSDSSDQNQSRSPDARPPQAALPRKPIFLIVPSAGGSFSGSSGSLVTQTQINLENYINDPSSLQRILNTQPHVAREVLLDPEWCKLAFKTPADLWKLLMSLSEKLEETPHIKLLDLVLSQKHLKAYICDSFFIKCTADFSPSFCEIMLKDSERGEYLDGLEIWSLRKKFPDVMRAVLAQNEKVRQKYRAVKQLRSWFSSTNYPTPQEFKVILLEIEADLDDILIPLVEGQVHFIFHSTKFAHLDSDALKQWQNIIIRILEEDPIFLEAFITRSLLSTSIIRLGLLSEKLAGMFLDHFMSASCVDYSAWRILPKLGSRYESVYNQLIQNQKALRQIDLSSWFLLVCSTFRPDSLSPLTLTRKRYLPDRERERELQEYEKVYGWFQSGNLPSQAEFDEALRKMPTLSHFEDLYFLASQLSTGSTATRALSAQISLPQPRSLESFSTPPENVFLKFCLNSQISELPKSSVIDLCCGFKMTYEVLSQVIEHCVTESHPLWKILYDFFFKIDSSILEIRCKDFLEREKTYSRALRFVRMVQDDIDLKLAQEFLGKITASNDFLDFYTQCPRLVKRLEAVSTLQGIQIQTSAEEITSGGDIREAAFSFPSISAAKFLIKKRKFKESAEIYLSALLNREITPEEKEGCQEGLESIMIQKFQEFKRGSPEERALCQKFLDYKFLERTVFFKVIQEKDRVFHSLLAGWVEEQVKCLQTRGEEGAQAKLTEEEALQALDFIYCFLNQLPQNAKVTASLLFLLALPEMKEIRQAVDPNQQSLPLLQLALAPEKPNLQVLEAVLALPVVLNTLNETTVNQYVQRVLIINSPCVANCLLKCPPILEILKKQNSRLLACADEPSEGIKEVQDLLMTYQEKRQKSKWPGITWFGGYTKGDKLKTVDQLGALLKKLKDLPLGESSWPEVKQALFGDGKMLAILSQGRLKNIYNLFYKRVISQILSGTEKHLYDAEVVTELWLAQKRSNLFKRICFNWFGRKQRELADALRKIIAQADPHSSNFSVKLSPEIKKTLDCSSDLKNSPVFQTIFNFKCP